MLKHTYFPLPLHLALINFLSCYSFCLFPSHRVISVSKLEGIHVAGKAFYGLPLYNPIKLTICKGIFIANIQFDKTQNSFKMELYPIQSLTKTKHFSFGMGRGKEYG